MWGMPYLRGSKIGSKKGAEHGRKAFSGRFPDKSGPAHAAGGKAVEAGEEPLAAGGVETELLWPPRGAGMLKGREVIRCG